MESDKEHIRFLFCFHQKKSAADACKICENVIECVRIGLNESKTIISISVIKISDVLQL